MPAAGSDGYVTWFVAFRNPTDNTGVRLRRFQITSTSASLGAVADTVAASFAITVTATSYSIMHLNTDVTRPILEARATTVANSTIPNGATVLLAPST